MRGKTGAARRDDGGQSVAVRGAMKKGFLVLLIRCRSLSGWRKRSAGGIDAADWISRASDDASRARRASKAETRRAQKKAEQRQRGQSVSQMTGRGQP